MLRAKYVKMEGDGLVHFIVNDVSVYVGRQREGGDSSIERTSLRLYHVVSIPSTGILQIFVEKRTMLKMQEPVTPPSVYQGTCSC